MRWIRRGELLKIALIFQQNLGKLGIELEIVQKEWTVFIDEVKNHNFEIALNGLYGSRKEFTS